MTPSNPSPDTGAGTPLTAEEEVSWRRHMANWTAADVARLFATLDAARSRPATDPAGLDAALDALTDDDVMYDHPVAMSGEPMDLVLFVRYDAIKDAAARLSVADGPGPEERS